MHVDPLAREFVQSPIPPFVGGADASHGSGSHVVSAPAESSPAAFVEPVGQATHAFDTTRWFEPHPQAVLTPAIGSSPAALNVPAAHDVHDPEDTYSFVAHVQNVSDPVASSPAVLVVPAAHAVQDPEDTL